MLVREKYKKKKKREWNLMKWFLLAFMFIEIDGMDINQHCLRFDNLNQCQTTGDWTSLQCLYKVTSK